MKATHNGRTAEDSIDIAGYDDMLLERALKELVKAVGHEWNADAEILLVTIQLDIELDHFIEKAKDYGKYTKKGESDRGEEELSLSRTEKVINVLFEKVMSKYGKRLKTFMIGDDIVGMYVYQNKWRRFENGITAEIESLDEDLKSLVSQHVVNEVIAKIQRNTLTQMPRVKSFIQFKNAIIDVKRFVEGESLTTCIFTPSEEFYAFYSIDREIAIDHDIIQALETKVMYGVEDVASLAEKYTPNVVRLFKEWADDWIVLYEILGYTLLTYGNPLKILFILTGDPDSGKSTYINFLTYVIGQENVLNESLQRLMSNNFALSQLFLKMLNAHADLPDRAVDVAEMKVLTGNDSVTADIKYKSPITFQVTTKFIFAVNQLPSKWESADEGFWSRVRLVKFPRNFSRIGGKVVFPDDREISYALLLSLFFAKNMVTRGDITSSEEGKLLLERAKRQNESVEFFLAEATEKDDKASTDFKDIYNAYLEWCKKWSIQPVMSHFFSKRLRDKGFETIPVMGKRKTKGLKLKGKN